MFNRTTGHCGVLNTTRAILRPIRFCWKRMFLSAVRSTSKPARSASASNSPLESLSHPRSLASVTVWSVRWEDNGAGVLWSKRTNIGLRRGCRLDRDLLSIEAAGGKFQNLDDPLLLDVKPLRDLIDGGSAFFDCLTVAFLACSPAIGRSFISAARHMYQLATLRYGRQRSP